MPRLSVATASNDVQSSARMIAGALAHLGRHMETGCPRSATLAALLLEQVARDQAADEHLRRHARELVDILERDDEPVPRTRGNVAVARA